MMPMPAVHTSDLVARLLDHPLHAAVRDESGLRLLQGTHVFCVWDFQCLLKALQRRLTCVEVPWLPTADPAARRLINEIVLDEESDAAPGGGHLSHFELYRLAMSDSGADTAPIDGFLAQLSGKPPEETAPAALSAGARDATGSASAAGTADADDMDSCIARALARRDLPAGVAAFTGESLRIARHGTLIELAATFTWGREDVIPELFTRLADALAERDPRAWGRFRHYLERHIERDGESHRPAAHALMARLCGQDAPAWAAAERAARAALSARLALWEAMHARLVAAQGAEAPSPALRAPAAAATWPPAARAPAAAAAPPSAHGTSAGG